MWSSRGDVKSRAAGVQMEVRGQVREASSISSWQLVVKDVYGRGLTRRAPDFQRGGATN